MTCYHTYFFEAVSLAGVSAITFITYRRCNRGESKNAATYIVGFGGCEQWYTMRLYDCSYGE